MLSAARVSLALVLAALVLSPSNARATDDRAEGWQGAWVIRDADYPGSIEAWSVHGDKVTVYDATRSSTQEEPFSVISPCRVARTRPLAQGATVTTYDTFVFASDGLHVAAAPASGGFRREGKVTACIGDFVYLYEGSGFCQRREATMTGPALDTKAECSIASDGLTSSFVLRAYGGGEDLRVPFHGDALLSAPLLARVAERWPTFEAAVQRAHRLRQQGAVPARPAMAP